MEVRKGVGVRKGVRSREQTQLECKPSSLVTSPRSLPRVRRVPSAVTISASRMLSVERPWLRVRWPTPPSRMAPMPTVPHVPK